MGDVNRKSRAIGLTVVAASLAACAGGGTAAVGPGGPTTAPTPVAGVVRVADAKPLADLCPGDLQANLTDKLSPPQVAGRAVYFGEVDEYDGDGDDAKLLSTLPVVAVKDGADWKAVPLAAAGLADTGWKYVGAGPAGGEVWGVLDTAAGDGGPAVVLAHSTDAGATFTLGRLPKPCPQATVFDFAMTGDGHGRVTLALDETVGPDHPGLYQYDTADGGRTWSTRPRYEPDGMTRADAVPDDEQPDPPAGGGGKGKTAWRGRARRPALVVVAVHRHGRGDPR